jgi:Fe2+ or Zn2+ uptake regulation protein
MKRLPCNVASEDRAEPILVHVLEAVKASGRRITRPLKEVIAQLARSNAPLGAYEIRDALKEQGKRVDVVTVYRILSELEASGLAHKVAGKRDGYVLCTISRAEPHPSMHLVCSSCGCAEEVPVPRSALGEILTQAGRHGFETALAAVSLSGLCTHCR